MLAASVPPIGDAPQQTATLSRGMGLCCEATLAGAPNSSPLSDSAAVLQVEVTSAGTAEWGSAQAFCGVGLTGCQAGKNVGEEMPIDVWKAWLCYLQECL